MPPPCLRHLLLLLLSVIIHCSASPSSSHLPLANSLNLHRYLLVSSILVRPKSILASTSASTKRPSLFSKLLPHRKLLVIKSTLYHLPRSRPHQILPKLNYQRHSSSNKITLKLPSYSVSRDLLIATLAMYVLQGVYPSITPLLSRNTLHLINAPLRNVHRLVTPLFLHASPTHLAVNVYSLINTAPHIEAIYGAKKMMLIYGASGIGGNVMSTALSCLLLLPIGNGRSSSSVFSSLPSGIRNVVVGSISIGLRIIGTSRPSFVSLGASSGISGLMGAFFAYSLCTTNPKTKTNIYRRYDEGSDLTNFYRRQNTIKQIKWVVFSNLFLTQMIGGGKIDTASHVGGGLAGFGMGWLMCNYRFVWWRVR